MEKNKNPRYVFPLTGLQIGDLQSYLSHLSLFLAPESKKFYILVDNRPWLRDLGIQSAHLWQFMVTKSRLSPFANTKTRKKKKERKDRKAKSESISSKSNRFKQWSSLIDAATSSRKRALLPVKKLRNSLFQNSKLDRILHGFIVFEVAWKDVHGINYLNELQTDTSLAIEAKFMKRWEFDSIDKAAKSISSWFPGTQRDQTILTDHLDSSVGEVFYDAIEGLPRNGNEEDESIFDENLYYKNVKYDSDCEDAVEPTDYKNMLILFRFNDHDLPFELKDIIISDLRLLTLLEYGLPSWVLFFQSYPVFCHLYRPWMCPLARALYVLISVVTVLIGFYDLYKNVPVLKATASRLCGPLFDWIETWEMISRIKYLGTMLFLHNFEKAVKWFMLMTRATRSFVNLITRPMAGPFMELVGLILPAWNLFVNTIDGLVSVVWMIIGSAYNLVETLVETMLKPIWFTLSLVWNMAMSIIYPMVWIVWEIVYAPIRLVIGLFGLMSNICSFLYDSLGDVWMFTSNVLKIASNAETTISVSPMEVSIWRSLWNDLFSQVFRALRSILNGFVAFFTACNRHRLSIYNHGVALQRRVSRRPAQGNRQLERQRSRHRRVVSGEQNTPVKGGREEGKRKEHSS
ncbi:uncharacterized protein LOC124944939 [Impatiens glandulifera]|uniref:uncharacterized protein LOC124944939 n=1 Tax=Impatiens glandulifera TaxID=253017 RepID=UPI001FB12E0D|nr:uncharacterized protein LOC124944939 [Impatiens glandulifera]XP_047341244.1 uncharacterized protein LOC124944939 [Impatiens glandulifera]